MLASRASPLNSGDKRWRDCTNFQCDCCASAAASESTSMNLVTLLNEREDAATRRAVVEGKVQWSVLDRALEVGSEKHRWQLSEIVWAEVRGNGQATISDHAAVCYERPVIRAAEAIEGRPALPSMRAWKEFHQKQFEALTEGRHRGRSTNAGRIPAGPWNSSTPRCWTRQRRLSRVGHPAANGTRGRRVSWRQSAGASQARTLRQEVEPRHWHGARGERREDGRAHAERGHGQNPPTLPLRNLQGHRGY